jgi:LuxR family transcriptional regulator, maltose regulon positive regulatory protein
LENNQSSLATEELSINTSMAIENQLLATKFYVPRASHTLISRPRLTALLQESLECPLTLVSAPAGFGKTTLLAAWGQSLSKSQYRLCWISLDEEDNDPRLFWTYVLSALQMQRPERFTPLLTQFQARQALSLKSLQIALINLLADSDQHYLLIVDDYHLITKQEVHTTLAYLIEHSPAQLHIILATRVDPPLPLSLQRANRQICELRTEQLRCTVEETDAFFEQVVGIQLSGGMSQQVTTRTEGWLVGLQLLGLSLSEQANPLSLPQEVSGSQRYILDYLTEEVLRRQPQEVQRFLLYTCILEQLSAPLCDAVMQQKDSQQMLKRLEEANLFVVSLDNKRCWYRYHALFAEALHYQLEQMHPELVPILHHRASLWYGEHNRVTQAILHAFHAKEWQWAADLIEREHLPLVSYTWGAAKHVLFLLRQWLEQLPADLLYSRPCFCLACAQMLHTVTPHSTLQTWLDAAEAMLTASLTRFPQEEDSSTRDTLQARQKLQDLLGEVFALRAFLWSHIGDGGGALALSEHALALLSPENSAIRVQAAFAQLIAAYASSTNDVEAAVESGLRAGALAQATGQTARAIIMMGTTAKYMLGGGRLHDAQRLSQEAILLGREPREFVLSGVVGWPMVWQAEVLRERNELDAALSMVQEAIKLCEQTPLMSSLVYLLCGYTVLIRIHLSRKDFDQAYSALEQFQQIGTRMNQNLYMHIRSLFTTVDQVKVWLACGKLDHARRWVQQLDIGERHGTPFGREREEVACVRIFLAQAQPDLALQRLEPALERGTAGKRWGHVIEMWLLRALAFQMQQEEMQALDALSEAIRLAEPQGYIRSFVDAGAPMETLLQQLRKQNLKQGLTLYLDTLLTTFQQKSMVYVQAEEQTQDQVLPESLSKRELQVLRLLASGGSNLEIAQELVITVDTVKRHVSNIFSKLGVQNRVQAVRKAEGLGLRIDSH